MKKIMLSLFKYDTETNMLIWLSIQTIIIIFACLLAFGSVIISAKIIFGHAESMSLGYALGMILPLTTLIGILNFFLFKSVTNYITILSKAMKQLTDGEFDVKLNNKYGIFRDLDESFLKMCTELKNVQLLRNDFVNSYSHEFKTPIVSIKGFADLLLEDNLTENEQKQYLRIISDEALRLAELSDSIILLANLESQEIIIEKMDFRLDEQIKQCAIMLSPEWGKKEINLTCDLDKIFYRSNPKLTHHIWINLISNAIKFTPEHGEISITARKQDDSIVITVSDTGIGMSKENATHIFEKYYQSDKSHNKRGMGLGLSIARHVVELCEGTIMVESSLNTGSHFIVKLPRISNHCDFMP